MLNIFKGPVDKQIEYVQEKFIESYLEKYPNETIDKALSVYKSLNELEDGYSLNFYLPLYKQFLQKPFEEHIDSIFENIDLFL